MTSESWDDLPARPDHVAEWEDLLVRLELMPRAVRVALDERDIDPSRVHSVLDELLKRESWVGKALEAAALTAAGLPLNAPDDPGRGDVEYPQVVFRQEDALERFVRLRNRNFAMVQRRGITVWDWEAPVGAEGRATVYQLLSVLARGDVRALAILRHESVSRLAARVQQ
jgi:hypothetical protein